MRFEFTATTLGPAPNQFDMVKNGVADAAVSLHGFTPARFPLMRIGEMLKRGTVDGLLMDTSSFADFNMAGTVKHMLDFPRGLFAGTFMVIVNKRKWNSISEADRSAIDKVSGETLSRAAGLNWDMTAAKARASLKPAGVEITMAEGAYLKELEHRLRFLEDEWLKHAAAAGIPPESTAKQRSASCARSSPAIR